MSTAPDLVSTEEALEAERGLCNELSAKLMAANKEIETLKKINDGKDQAIRAIVTVFAEQIRDERKKCLAIVRDYGKKAKGAPRRAAAEVIAAAIERG